MDEGLEIQHKQKTVMAGGGAGLLNRWHDQCKDGVKPWVE